MAKLKYKLNFLILLFLVFYITSIESSIKCTLCKEIVAQFNQALQTTAQSNFGGGNTNWEESRLGSFYSSETRFVEIMDHLCDKENKKECHQMVEENEETLENWWFSKYSKGEDLDLHVYLCEQTLNVCCPNGSYGSDCLECPGGKTLPCNKKGVCDGEGTKSGTGKCKCDTGYTGDTCDDCQARYFLEDLSEEAFQCKECHASCSSSCAGPDAMSCDGCKSGWKFELNLGCVDINECLEETFECSENLLCVNKEGSYTCETCNSVCLNCTGLSEQDCITCNVRHYREGDTCKACHPSCENYCADELPGSCDNCKAGWSKDENTGDCIDINECDIGSHSCSANEFCENSEGSLKCKECHKNCKSCSSIEHCLECKEGYTKSESGTCVDLDECQLGDAVCKGDFEKCNNTEGNYTCECLDGYVRRMGSPCFKKHIAKKKKAKKSKEEQTEGQSEKTSIPLDIDNSHPNNKNNIKPPIVNQEVKPDSINEQPTPKQHYQMPRPSVKRFEDIKPGEDGFYSKDDLIKLGEPLKGVPKDKEGEDLLTIVASEKRGEEGWGKNAAKTNDEL